MAKRAKKYTVTDGKLVLVLEAAEEGGYVVTAPLIDGLITQAETLEEAYEMARDAAATLRADRVAERKARNRVAAKKTA